MDKHILTDEFFEPLNGVTTAKIDINAGDGNLTIYQLIGCEQVLTNGTLQYLEKQDPPARSLVSRGGQADFTLKGSPAGQPWFRFPWAACNGATDWQIHLNPTVSTDITAHSDGGNVKLNLAGMIVTRVSADTGGGNIDVVLPEDTANFSVTVRTGAGNVNVEIGSGMTGSNIVNANSGAGNVVMRIPSGVAARIHATTGLGKASVDPRFSQTEDNTYQSPDYHIAADRVEITVNSGAGNVIVDTRHP